MSQLPVAPQTYAVPTTEPVGAVTLLGTSAQTVLAPDPTRYGVIFANASDTEMVWLVPSNQTAVAGQGMPLPPGETLRFIGDGRLINYDCGWSAIASDANVPLSIMTFGGNGTITPDIPVGEFSIDVNMTGVYQGSGLSPLTPTTQNFQYYTNFGVPRFRIPFAWSITQTFPPFATTGIQLTTFASLDAGYLAVLDQTITNCIAAGGKCILDCHMFMEGPGGFQVGSAQVPTTALADMWGKIAAHYVANPTLLSGIDAFEFMNEPPNGFSISTIITAYQQCINAVRAAGYTGKIHCDGTNFTSAWNWTSGQGQPFNNSTLNQLVDPLNKLVFPGHLYPDPDDSGSGFSYANSIVTPGSAPPGINTNPNIFVQRASREYVPWLQGFGLQGYIGEYGSSSDSPNAGGSYNFAAWDTITFNALTYAQPLGLAVAFWSAGPGFPAGFGGYGYSLDPFNSALDGTQDFSSAGVQAPVIAIIQQFTGYSGPQPTAYAFFSPSFPSLDGTRAVANTPTSNFTIYYGGVLSVARHITPTVYLSDGVTPATGVTVTPSTVTLNPGTNPLGTFTFTTNTQNRYVIKLTNDAGWTDPPSVFVSSVPDDFLDIPVNQIQGIISLSRIYSLYNGACLIALNPNTGLEVTFNFTTNGSPDVATWQALVGGGSSCKIIRLDNQGPGGSLYDWTPLFGYAGPSGSNAPSSWPASSPSDYPTLVFADPVDGLPKIVFTTPNRMYTNVGLNGLTGLTISGRFNDAGAHIPEVLSQNLFVGGPLNWGPAGIGVKHGASGASVVSLSYVADPGSWQTYGATLQSSIGGTTANGLQLYLNSTLNNEIDVPAYSFDPQFGALSTDAGQDRYVPSLQWQGAFRSLRILAGSSPVSPAKIAAFSATDTANWGAPFTPPVVTFSFPAIGVNNDGNSVNTGTLNDYLGNNSITQNAQVAYWSGQLFNVLRMGFNWTNIQPTLQAPLDPTAMSFLKTAVDLCIASNIGVLLDNHGNDSGTRGPGINSAADYGDLWGRLGAFFSYVTNQDMVMYNVVSNEPQGVTQGQLNTLVQAAITGIRNAGATGWIIIDGLNFTKPQTFVTNGPAMIAGLTDALNKTGYDIHWYFDSGSQGTSPTAVAGSGNALLSCSRMARQNGIKLFYGELGIANNAGMQTEASTALQIVSNYRDVWLGTGPWTSGTLFPQSYFQNLGQGGLANASVAAVLLPHGDARHTQGTLSGVIVNWASTCDGGYIPSTITPGTVVATLAPNDQNLKGATYIFTDISDPSSLFTISGTNLVLANAPTNGTTYSVTLHVADNLGRSASTVVAVVGADNVYLNPNFTSANIALSNGNLTATFSTSAFGTRTTRGVPVGSKCYWEVHYDSGSGGFLGACNADANPNTDTSTLALSIPNQGSYVGFGFQSNGNMQPTFVANVGITYSATHVVCHALANINGAILYWARLDNGNWNGSPTANPTTGVGGVPIGYNIPGTLYPYLGLMGNTQAATFRLKSSDFGFTPPSGFGPIP